MPRQTKLAKRGTALALSGALVLAFAPGLNAPSAYAATEAQVTAVKATIDVYRTNGDASEVTEAAATNVLQSVESNGVTLSELPVEYQNYVLRCQLFDAQSDYDDVKQDLDTAQKENETLKSQVADLQKQLETANAKVADNEKTAFSKVSVSKLTATASGMGKVALSWQVANAVDGIAYQVRYQTGSSKAAKTTSKTTSKTVSKLSGGKAYSFQVRAYKTIDGKRTYGKWSSKASATPLPTYKKGTYKVTGDALNVRKKASTSSKLLVAVLKGKKVKVTKLKAAGGAVWGKLTYKGQTGWAQMQYLKKA